MQESQGMATLACPRSVPETVARLTRMIHDKGLTLFAVIDHSGAAAEAGLAMPDTKVVVFGSPAADTPVMLAAPLVASDLPLKILVWQSPDGATWVSYTTPEFLAARHGLSQDLAARLRPVAAIAAALVDPED